jgi:hypothetical protein
MNKRRPLWDDSLADRTQYRLTYAEQIQRKAALVSKNKESAREELQKRQELLKQGKIPEEIKKTMRNVSAKPKTTSANNTPCVMSNAKNSLKNLKEPKAPEQGETHFAPLKKTQKPSIEDHLDTLTKLDQAMKELEAAMIKAASPEGKQCEEVKVLDESISEGSLFGFSDDEEGGMSRISEKSKVNNDDLRSRYHEILQDVNKEYSCHTRDFEEDFMVSTKHWQEQKSKEKTQEIREKPQEYREKQQEIRENTRPDMIFQRKNDFFKEEPITFDNVWADEDAFKILSLVEETRKDLCQMNISTNEDFEVSIPSPQPFQYDSDVIPQKFNLVPLDKPSIPRAGTSSLSIFNHVRNVKLDCRKFIIN